MIFIRLMSKRKRLKTISNNLYKTRNLKSKNLLKNTTLNFRNRILNYLSSRNNWVKSKTRSYSSKSICSRTCRLIRKPCNLNSKSKRIRVILNFSKKNTILKEWSSSKMIWISNCRPPKSSFKIVKSNRTIKNRKSRTSSNIIKNCRRTSKE